MLSSKEFFSNNEEVINQEIDAILTNIGERLGNGYCSVNWVLSYAPAGALQFIALKVKENMKKKGWNTEAEVNYSRHLLILQVSPDLSMNPPVASIPIVW